MPIVLMKRYSPEICRQNPDWLFVFDDNMGGKSGVRTGLGGQACIRNEPNVIGIATKFAPSAAPEAYFSDTARFINMAKAEFEDKFYQLEKYLSKDVGVIVYPVDGIGTGLAELPQRAPEIWNMLEDYRNNLFNRHEVIRYD